MSKHGGSTQGFGRVSTHTRPSPYSPLQFRGPPTTHGKMPAVPQRSKAVTRGRRMAYALAVVAMVVVGIGLIALSRPTSLPVPPASAVPAPTLAPGAGDQAQRLAPLPVPKRP